MGPALLCLHLPIQYLKWNVWQNQDKPRRSTLRILFSQQEWKDHLPVFQGPHTHRESRKGVLILPMRPLGTGDGLGRSPHPDRTPPPAAGPPRGAGPLEMRSAAPTVSPRPKSNHATTSSGTFSAHYRPELWTAVLQAEYSEACARRAALGFLDSGGAPPPVSAAHPRPPGAGSGGLCWTHGLRGPEALSRTCAETVPRWRPQPRARVRPRALTADPERG